MLIGVEQNASKILNTLKSPMELLFLTGLRVFCFMAKELPYFKFEPNQWENGNIQICSREDKGLFLDLCSMYWSRLGKVPFKLAVQKLCNGNATAFDSLIDEGIFTVIDNDICIEFLNEQLQEFEDQSEINRKNALEGWKKRRESDRNATASKPQSETNAIREDKIRKENSIEDRKREFYNSLIPYVDEYGKAMLKEFYDYWTEHGEKDRKFRMEKEKSFDTKKRLERWKSKSETFGKSNNPKATDTVYKTPKVFN